MIAEIILLGIATNLILSFIVLKMADATAQDVLFKISYIPFIMPLVIVIALFFAIGESIKERLDGN